MSRPLIYSGIWDTAAGAKHPDWAIRGSNGKPVGAPFSASDKLADARMCLRGPYLEKLMLPQMKELITWVWGLDGSRCEARFLSTRGKPWDIMLWAFYCSHGMNPADSPWVAKPAEMLMQESAVLLA